MRINYMVVILYMLVVPFSEGSVLDSVKSFTFQISNALLNRLGNDLITVFVTNI